MTPEELKERISDIQAAAIEVAKRRGLSGRATVRFVIRALVNCPDENIQMVGDALLKEFGRWALIRSAGFDHSRTLRKVVAARHQKDAPATRGVPGLQETFLSVFRPTLTIYTCWLTRTLQRRRGSACSAACRAAPQGRAPLRAGL